MKKYLLLMAIMLSCFCGRANAQSANCQVTPCMLFTGVTSTGFRYIISTDNTGKLLTTGTGASVAAQGGYIPQVLVMGVDSSGVFHVLLTDSTGVLQTSGGGGGTPGGTANQIQYNSAGTSFGGFTMSGDCTVVVATGIMTCTQSNGTLLTALFAPISGSANYAPATGSPNYAPISGSANYAPATGSANYAPATGSSAYAPITGSAVYAPLASPTLTGTPTAPTQSAGDSSTDIATDAFVQIALNVMPQTGLTGEWDMNEGSGTSLVDSTGVTGNGTLGTSTAAPTWVAAGTHGKYVMRFTDTTTSGAGQYVTMPAAFNTAATMAFMIQLPYVNQYGTETSSPTNPSFLCSSTTTPKTCIYMGGPTGFFTNLITSYNTGPSCGAPIQAGWHSIIFAWGSSGDSTYDQVYIDGNPCYLTTTNTRYRNSQTVSWQLGGSTALTGSWWNSQMSQVVTYSTYATQSAATTLSNAMWTVFNLKGIQTTPNVPQTILNQNVLDGDSRVAGYLSVPLSTYVTGLSNTYTTSSKATTGASATDNCAGFSQYAMQYFAPNAVKNNYVFGPAAANDFKDSSGSGVQFAELSYACVAQRAWAKGYRTILVGETSSLYNSNNDAYVQALNQWLQTNLQNVNGTYFIDTGADVDLGCAGCYSSSAASNLSTGFFIANIHWQTPAVQIVGALVSCAINSLDGTTAANPGSYTASTVTLGCGDNYTLLNTTANNITATLPSCTAFIGRERKVVNTTTSGSNTLTFATAFPAGVSTTLSAAITTTTQSPITVTSASGFPAAPFNITIGSETLYVTAVAGTSWTVLRGVSASTAATATNGATVSLVSQTIVGPTTLANGLAESFIGHRLSQTAGGCYWTVQP